MEPFIRVTATALPLEKPNMDTDQLIPARFLLKPRDDKYRTYLFHDLRFNEDGSEKPDFVLNQPLFRDARIIVGNRNFGCGSSREGAVFALTANGFRSAIAPSFGDIFYNNCFNNGVLPVVLPDDAVTDLRARITDRPGATITVDLEAQTVTGPDGSVYRFEIDPHRKHRLLNGLDAVSYTLQFEDEMIAFETAYRKHAGWLY
jgi:3-isopropylmalate/(R)-2-methylmalate dehydratase small subunit